jgi:predicted  nucleic acid-binding Zn-ribbon protein
MNQPLFKWDDDVKQGQSATATESGDKPMEENTMDNLKLLEDKIIRAVEALKQQREETRALAVKVTALEDEILAKDEELEKLRADVAESERVRGELARMNEERSAVRLQVEDLLKELEGIELP